MQKCIFYGDCDYGVSFCEEEEPWGKCHKRIVIPARFILAATINLAIPSLDPENFENLGKALNQLAENRKIDFKA